MLTDTIANKRRSEVFNNKESFWALSSSNKRTSISSHVSGKTAAVVVSSMTTKKLKFLTVVLLAVVVVVLPSRSTPSQTDVCVTSDGKQQPLFFNDNGKLVYPERSCSFYGYSGEHFKNVKWVGCAGSTNNMLTLSKKRETIAKGGVLIRVSPSHISKRKNLAYYSCRHVNTATVLKKSGGRHRGGDSGVEIYEVVFKFDGLKHVIYTIKWNKDENRPIWVRHHPSIMAGVIDTSLIDASIRAPWRASKLVFGEDTVAIKKAYKTAYTSFGMSRGHLAPAADFLLAAERWATFQLANVAPQPQTHNNGEWKVIEGEVRERFNSNDVEYIETGPVYDRLPNKICGLLPIPKGMYKKVMGEDGDVLYHATSMY